MNKVNQKYAYISHPDKLNLELNGKSKKKSVCIRRQEYNGDRGNINQESRSLIMKKMSNNIHDLANTKSVLPSNHRKQIRPNSIKTFKQDKQNYNNASGIDYLMHKTENLKLTNHKQRAHVQEVMKIPSKRPQKKHFGQDSTENSGVVERQRVTHKLTSDLRFANDLYSNVYRMQKQAQLPRKIESANLFRNGQQLGFERQRQKKISDNKLIQMVGSQHVKEKPSCLQERRQDWRISNINFF